MKPPLIVILGPTASGKTRLATHLAYKLDGEIISVDSRQVYRGMNIGTGKDLQEYIVNQKAIKYHLIDIVEAGEKYNVYQYQQDFKEVITAIYARQKQPILCGGTGLYIEAVLKNYHFTAIPIDENLRQTLSQLSTNELLAKFKALPSVYTSLADISTRKRLIRAIEIATFLTKNQADEWANRVSQDKYFSNDYIIFGLTLPVELRRERITKRLHERLHNGMIEEVKQLLEKGILPEQLFYYGLEYKFITQFIVDQIDYDTMVAQLNVAIHQFAKRQMTFFRKMERDGLTIHWLDATLPTTQLISTIEYIIQEKNESSQKTV